MNVNYYPIIRGLASYFLPKKLFRRPGSGGTFSSEYCYSVWLRHLYYLTDSKLVDNIGDLKNIAEIGPGDSLGIGISALYTGAANYYAFDVIKHTNLQRNLTINKELLKYFEERLEIPHGSRLRETAPVLSDYSFPNKIIKYEPKYYKQKYNEIEACLNGVKSQDHSIKYIVPWTNAKLQSINNIDLIFSQAVMEHIEEIDFAYGEMYKWLKKGGIISHQIDFKAHEITKEWNGHWFISEIFWKFLLHGRKYSINRLPLSSHINAIKKAGFTIKTVLPVQRPNSYNNSTPKVKNVEYNQEDLITSGALIQAVKE
jgi:SAM-dependent methyltransferase